VLHDSATFTLRAVTTKGTVTFRLYKDPDLVPDTSTCNDTFDIPSANKVYEEGPVPVDSLNTATTTTGYSTNVSGIYYWRAFYSGDQNNAAASTACGQEVTWIKAKDKDHSSPDIP